MYYKNGKLDRGNDLPAIIYCTGVNEYYQDGKLHRIGAPGYQSRPDYYFNGVLHNEHGAAIEYPCGYKEWRLNGVMLSGTEFNEYLEKIRN